MRIGRQITGTGAADVTDRLLPDSTQLSLQHYAKALDVLGASSRPGMMRLNAPGSGYQQLLRGPAEDLPFIGPSIRRALSEGEAREALQKGGEIQQRAAEGATTAPGLGVTTPYVSALNNPTLPFFSWRPQAFKAGVPSYKMGGARVDVDGAPDRGEHSRPLASIAEHQPQHEQNDEAGKQKRDEHAYHLSASSAAGSWRPLHEFQAALDARHPLVEPVEPPVHFGQADTNIANLRLH